METTYFKNHKIRYVDVGKGPPMVFLHNGGSGHWIWKYQIDHFSKSHRVLALDLLGCGSSDRPPIKYDLNLYVGMLKEFLANLNLTKVILVGNCVGAATALEYAIVDPAKIDKLILFNLCGGPPMMTWPVRLVSSGSSLPKIFESVHCWALRIFTRIPGMIWMALRTNYGRSPNRQDPVYLLESKEAANTAQALPRINLIRGLPSFAKFSSDFHRPVHLPSTYVFWGAGNRVLPLRKGKLFCDRLRPTKTNFVVNTGHMVMSEAHEYVNGEMDRFVGRVC